MKNYFFNQDKKFGFSIITDGEPDTPEAVRDVLSELAENEILPFLFIIGQEHERCAKSIK